jgi:hypothetical protein
MEALRQGVLQVAADKLIGGHIDGGLGGQVAAIPPRICRVRYGQTTAFGACRRDLASAFVFPTRNWRSASQHAMGLRFGRHADGSPVSRSLAWLFARPAIDLCPSRLPRDLTRSIADVKAWPEWH